MKLPDFVKTHRQEILDLLTRYPTLSNPRIWGAMLSDQERPEPWFEMVVDTKPNTSWREIGGLQYELEKLLKVEVYLRTDRMMGNPNQGVMAHAQPL
ncbi:MAG: hypothetical protein QM537_00650 [Candidatus Symbiobacter sp.]|nr:hypothetical protein [Candidatus Symbiobacter sp.]